MSVKQVRKLQVSVDGIRAGTVHRERGAEATFSYARSYLARPNPTPLSLSLPRRSGTKARIGNWIDGALPDNDSVRSQWASEHSSPSTHPVDLLSTPIGLECAGAVQFHTGPLPKERRDLTPVSHEDIARWAQTTRLPKSGWSSILGAGRFSLGGAQAKSALYWSDGNWYAPSGDHPTNRILKVGVADRRYPDAAAIEHVCMRAASRIGLRVSETELLDMAGQTVLSVSRFDRTLRNGTLTRVHSEDMCQATGHDRLRKFERYGGPSFSDIARLLSASSSFPQNDIKSMVDALIYNWVIGGTDAHAKNYSVTLSGTEVRLAPLYDVISVFAWEDPTDSSADLLELAMRVGTGGYAIADADNRSAWTHVADTAGLERETVLYRTKWMLNVVPDAIRDSINELPASTRKLPVLKNLQLGIAARARRVKDKLD